MRQSRADLPPPEWRILSTFVRTRDGPQRLEQAFQFLLGRAEPAAGAIPLEGSSDHACSDLRPRLDRPPGA
jgi:hypothetical protein